MADQQKPKIQPWKAMKTFEEEPNPEFGKLQKFITVQPLMGNGGSTVSRPIYRKTAHEVKQGGAGEIAKK